LWKGSRPSWRSGSPVSRGARAGCPLKLGQDAEGLELLSQEVGDETAQEALAFQSPLMGQDDTAESLRRQVFG